MKRLIFTILISIVLIGNVEAFSIDVDKIDINKRSSKLIDSLDSQYNIEVNDFSKKITNDEDVSNLVKELIKISFNEDKDIDEKRKEFTQYLYLSQTNGVDSINANLFIKMYLEKLAEYDIKFETIKDIKTVSFNENDMMAFAYIDDVLINDKKQEIVLVYWFKKNNGESYKIYYPWLTIGDDLEKHFKEVSEKETKGNVIGGTYNQVSLLENGNVAVNNSVLNSIYNNGKNSVVQITGISNTDNNMYGSGFFIKEGVVVTTWSLFLKFLTESNYIYVNDCNGKTYEVLGVIAAQSDYDVVVLKISEEVGSSVILGNTNNIKTGDKLFTINSKNNNTFSINYGANISVDSGRLKNMFAISESDVGSALFDKDGKVVGFVVADQINSELSFANSTDYLANLQNILKNKSYSEIGYTKLESFKQSYYLDFTEEKKYNNVDEDIWNKYKDIGKLEESIELPMIKAEYTDKILSLRYKNETDNMLDSLYLVSNFTDELVNSGYELSYLDSNKTIYENNEYKIVIKNNLNYLIILIMGS